MGLRLNDMIFEQRMRFRLTRGLKRKLKGHPIKSNLITRSEYERVRHKDVFRIAVLLLDLQLTSAASQSTTSKTPPKFGERILLLVLRTKEERANIPGDLEEEYWGIAEKHGKRFAKLWYYKQVVASAWPMIRKAVRWGMLASIGTWIRRFI